MADTTRQLITPARAAEIFGVHRETIYLWIKDGRLPAVKLSRRMTRIRMADVDALIERSAA
ncbi:MAG: Helix-turn-helix domain [Gemmatimonadetes bacterium]|nr:Helix-turn-helix domain [Gemmatimonadota bacterium]